MKTRESIIAGLKSIFLHKLRSLLTITGIVIGVAAITTMFSSVQAMKDLIDQTISGLGYDNTIVLYPSYPSTEQNKSRKYTIPQRFNHLNYKDYELLKRNLKEIEFIYPAIEDQKNAIIKSRKSKIRLKGIGKEFFSNKNYVLGKGRLFSDLEENKGVNVCVIGATVKEKFFPDREALGEYINLDNISLKIIGILAKEDYKNNIARGNEWERKMDHETCFLPAKCAAKYFRPNRNIDNIWIKTKKAEKVGEVYNRARQLILSKHNMADDLGMKDISKEMLEVRAQIDKYMKNWNIILICISSISLFTGGIGLFSILLISIRERMTEIGIRKSIGAKNIDIFSHFIIEAILLALIGGIIGSGLSLILIEFLTSQIGIRIPFPILGLSVGLTFAVIIGIISGSYPAFKASKIDPIKAIFYSE